MQGFLKTIVDHKKSLLIAKKAFFNEVRDQVDLTQLTHYRLFKKVISRPEKINLIAEIKKASPSRGIIRKDFNALEIAKIYFESGAAALSVLTEEKYFLGKLSYIRDIQASINIPILRKDFIIDEAQIYESFRSRASAILLIVAILNKKKLQDLIKMAKRLDLDPIVEIHNEGELEIALESGADIIGVNNRDLDTFQIDLNLSRQLIPKMPKDIITVVESGIKNHEDIKEFRDMGVNAVLIGETFMRSDDIPSKIAEIMGGQG